MVSFPAAREWLLHHPRVVLLLLGLLLYVPGSATLPLLDRDEPRFAAATQEMIERGEWIVPYFNGTFRFDKPILIYWMMRPFFWLLGDGELAARLPGILCMLALIVVVHDFARQWYGRAAGLVAGFGTATCLQFLLHGRLAVADLPLILSIAISHRAIWELLGLGQGDPRRKERHARLHYPWGWFWALYLSLGLGFLAKGPLALAVPLVTLLLFRFVFWRKDAEWSWLRLPGGLVITGALIAPWGIAALNATKGRFLAVGVGEHVINRGIESWGDRFFIGPFFYAGTTLVSLLPWVAFAAVAFGHSWRYRTTRTASLVSWFLAPFLIFSFYATQLIHYTLPGFPAFFILLGGAFRAGRDRGWDRWGWFHSVVAVYAVVAAALLLGGLFLGGPAPIDALHRVLVAAGLALAGLLLCTWSVRLRRSLIPAVAGLPLVVIGLLLAASTLRTHHPAIQLREVFARQAAGTRFLAHRYQEGSLVFYSRARWTMEGDPAAFQRALATPGPLCAVLLEEETDPAQWVRHRLLGDRTEPVPARRFDDDVRAALAAAGPGVTVTRVEGLNPGRTRWVRLVAIERAAAPDRPAEPEKPRPPILPLGF